MIPRNLQIAIIFMLMVAVGLGFYVLKLKRNAEQVQPDTSRVTPPVANSTQDVKLWVAYDNEGTLRERTVKIALSAEPSMRAQYALRALLAIYMEKTSPHPLGDAADIRDIYVVNDNTAIINVNAAFADTHRSGVFVEQLTLISLLQTLSATLPNVTHAKFLVDGKERDTLAGHTDLKNYYDMGTVRQLAQEMQ